MIYWPAHVSTRRPCFTSPWELARAGEGCLKRAPSTRGKKLADSTAQSAQFAMDGFRSRTATKSCGHHSCLRSSASKSKAYSLGLLCYWLASNTGFSTIVTGWAHRHDRLLKVIGFPCRWFAPPAMRAIALTRGTDLLQAGERAYQADKIVPWVAFRLPKVTHSVASSTSGRYTEADSSSLSPRSNSWVRGGSPSAVTGT
jgi:hypothetical protein